MILTHKLILLGDSSVGKTSLIKKHVYKRTIPSEPTVTVDFDSVYTKSKVYPITHKMCIWDTAGQERFRSLISSYCRESSVAIVTFDTTDFSSLINVGYWIKFLQESTATSKITPYIVLVGTKADIKDKKILPGAISKVASENNILYFETSTELNIGITELFDHIIDKLDSNIDTNDINVTNRVEFEHIGNKKCC